MRVIRDALAALRARRGRTLLAALGVLAASLVVGTATTVGYSLATGFDRSARAGRPARRDRALPAQPRRRVDERVSALPNLEARSYRFEMLNHELVGPRPPDPQGRDHDGDRRAPRLHDRRRPRPARRRRGRRRDRARARARVGRRRSATTWASSTTATLRVVGVAVAPDNVAYPLASAARVYISRAAAPGALRAPAAERRAAVAQRPGEGRRHAHPGARRSRSGSGSCSSSPARAWRSCSARPPGS